MGTEYRELGPLGRDLAIWEIHLRSTGKSTHTIRSYVQGVRALAGFLTDQGLPLDPEQITDSPPAGIPGAPAAAGGSGWGGQAHQHGLHPPRHAEAVLRVPRGGGGGGGGRPAEPDAARAAAHRGGGHDPAAHRGPAGRADRHLPGQGLLRPARHGAHPHVGVHAVAPPADATPASHSSHGESSTRSSPPTPSRRPADHDPQPRVLWCRCGRRGREGRHRQVDRPRCLPRRARCRRHRRHRRRTLGDGSPPTGDLRRHLRHRDRRPAPC